MTIVFLIFFSSLSSFAIVGKKSKISFSESLPEDISNDNFPDVIESFDYPNVELIDLINAVGKLTGLNFIISPNVTSKKITIIAPSKITVAEAYKAFLSALAINGFTLVKSGAFWKIQETKKALKDNTEIYSDSYFPNTDQLITRIIKLQHINAKEFSTSIKYLLSQDNQISHHESSNSLIISDYGSVIERIMKIVKEMDVHGSEENVEIIPVQYAGANDLANILSQLLALKTNSSRFGSSIGRSKRYPPLPSRVKKQKETTGNVKISSIIPDERTNSLVVSANLPGMKRVKALIKKLDTYVDPSRTGGIYVYNVLYGTAEQVYNTLMGISQNQSSSSSSQRKNGARPISRLGSSRFSSQSSPLFNDVTIMADSNTNSLIISAKNKYDFEKVKAVLKKIDVPKDQVFVQAVIVEMSVSKGDQWEVNLAQVLDQGLSKLLTFGTGGVSIAGFLNRSLSPNINTLQNNSLGPGLVLGVPFSSLLKRAGLSTSAGGVTSHDQISQELFKKNYSSLTEPERENVSNRYSQLQRQSSSGLGEALNQTLNLSMFPLLQILKQAGNVNILSTPQITALDNVKASIEVGENAPVGLTTSTGSVGAGVLNSVERQDITLRLEITPRINPDSGTIQMDILQKFDDFSSKQSSASELKSRGVHVIKRNIETKLVLHDGQTAVLGGLMTDKEVKNENKIPILGDIPVLGWIFKGSITQKEKRNLLVFITPTIIKGESQIQRANQLLSKKLEERIYFVKKYMSGTDPHGAVLKKLISQPDKKGEADLSIHASKLGGKTEEAKEEETEKEILESLDDDVDQDLDEDEDDDEEDDLLEINDL